ncbi:MAG: site-specific DNA-methyltransferase, partial [Planctomycetota bacterium]|nr:site-specific DNA-methyltransferase [Planctomycetota bacterium]
ALLPTYAGKVKCIFIDPPYNTGNKNWVYNDNVNSPMMQDWLGKVVDKEDLTRHDKWLCMMMPRLKLLRELLREDGFIFISIDDNEVHRLRLVLEEIFGENNFIGTIAWKKTSGDNKPSFAFTHDNIVIYGKNNIELPRLELSKEQLKQYQNPDNDPKGLWAETDYRSKWTKKERRNLYYAIINPYTKEKIFPDTYSESNRVWGCSKETHEKNEKEGLVWWGIDRTSREPKKKRYLVSHLGVNTRSVWLDAGSNDEASQEINEIGIIFDNPKPVKLIKRIIETGVSEDSIILDSFAGSGTTAHAVLNLNKEDGGNRKFILVECEDYADKITAERVRRVIKGVKTAKDEKLKAGLGGQFSYFELGDPIEMESILEGKKLPSYLDLARYVFYTATGEEFNSKEVNEKKHFIGSSKEYEVYLFYKPDIEYLKSTALTLDRAKALGPYKGRKRLVFAPTKYLDLTDSELIEAHGIKGIEFCQLPFEIYRLKE